MKDSSQFYANRVLKDNKETNPAAVEWSRSFITLLEELRKYIMQYHTTGLSWNPKGVDPGSYVAAPSAGSSAPAPPPPPPPPATVPSTPGSINTPLVADMGGVFASLNKGESVTKGLKKVDKSEMTHKNPELRAAGVVPSSLDSSCKEI
jgi:adenylyl cyclase-associated protein